MNRPKDLPLERPSPEAIEWALQQTSYKYFGDYEFTDEQYTAVGLLEDCAKVLLAAGPVQVWCVRCIEGGSNYEPVHVFSTAEKAKEFCDKDPRDHVTYDYVIDHPEHMEARAQ